MYPKSTFPMPNLQKSNFRARKLRNPTANAEHEKRTRPKQYEKWPRAALRGTLGCLIALHAWATRSWARARPTGTQSTVTHEERGNQIAHGTWSVAALCFSVGDAGKQAGTYRQPSGGRWLVGGAEQNANQSAQQAHMHTHFHPKACSAI